MSFAKRLEISLGKNIDDILLNDSESVVQACRTSEDLEELLKLLQDLRARGLIAPILI